MLKEPFSGSRGSAFALPYYLYASLAAPLKAALLSFLTQGGNSQS